MILNAISAGNGPPVILLHGLFGAAKNLGVISRGLADRAEVISLDLRNHGASPHGAAMDYATMAADVAETMAARGLNKARIVGHSMGGKVAMMLALTHPASVERLAVLDIAPVTYRHGHEDYIAAMQAIPLTSTLTRHEADKALQEVEPEASMRAFLLNNLILGAQPHWRVALPEIGAAMKDLIAWNDPPGWQPYAGPALFLHGGASNYLRNTSEAVVLEHFPKARIEAIAGAGHWLHAEQPQAVIAALTEFLFS